MKKLLLLVTGITVLALLYFIAQQNRSTVDQPLNVISPTTDKSISQASHKKPPVESVIDSKKINSTEKQLEPEIKQALEKMLNTSSDGLVEEKTDKGIRVDLKGRFQTVPVATINEKGEVEIQDYSSVPGKGSE